MQKSMLPFKNEPLTKLLSALDALLAVQVFDFKAWKKSLTRNTVAQIGFKAANENTTALFSDANT